MNKRMHHALPLGAFVLMATLMVTLGAAPASGAGGPPNAKPHVIFVPGIAKVGGEDVLVDIAVLVPAGKDRNEAAREALERQGARPFESAGLGSAGFTLTGLVWDTPVVQNYNPGSPKTENEPASLMGNGKTALMNTHATWDGVITSSFEINIGLNTDRCPSLVRECRGRQKFDGKNDVAWLKLAGNTLGVTWFGTSTDEADIALNTNFRWNDGCVDVTDSFAAQTVFLHENGHTVGLGHSDDSGSVMQPSYQVAVCNLGTDDEEGVTFLYDDDVTGSVSGTVTDGSDPLPGATVVLEGTGLSATTDGFGDYTISGVPDPVTYDVTASADGFESLTLLRLTVVVGGVLGADFALTATGGGNGGGVGDPPVVDLCDPTNGNRGDRLIVAVTGSNFQDGATADFGERVTVQNVTFVSPTQLDVRIRIHNRAASDPRDVTVTNPDGLSGTLTGCFTVN